MQEGIGFFTSAIAVYSQLLYCWDRHGEADGPAYTGLPNSQDLHPTVYETTGLYVFLRELALTQRMRYDPECCVRIPVSKIEAITIDTEEDWQFAELVWRGCQESTTA
jgi:hypothetical protein